MNLDDHESMMVRALIINESSAWWRREMKKTLEEIEVLDSMEFSIDKEEQESLLQGRLSYLIGKGKVERRAMRDFQDRIENLKKVS